jgi:hypothetical protein
MRGNMERRKSQCGIVSMHLFRWEGEYDEQGRRDKKGMNCSVQTSSAGRISILLFSC